MHLSESGFFFKNDIIGKPLLFHIYKEMTTPPRSPDVHDESIYDFVSRRGSTLLAENLVDPMMKGITGGDIKELSAASIFKLFYDAEARAGSVIKGIFLGKKKGLLFFA